MCPLVDDHRAHRREPCGLRVVRHARDEAHLRRDATNVRGEKEVIAKEGKHRHDGRRRLLEPGLLEGPGLEHVSDEERHLFHVAPATLQLAGVAVDEDHAAAAPHEVLRDGAPEIAGPDDDDAQRGVWTRHLRFAPVG